MKTVSERTNTIIKEITSVLDGVDESQVASLEERVLAAKTIVLVGAGRVGMAVRGFAMRLAHMGLDAHMIGDATVPSVGAGDLLVVASGSGETQTIYDLVAIAKKNGATIALVTGNPESRMGVLSDSIVKVQAPSKVKAVDGFISIQPMTTLNEQCLGIFFDAVVLGLMERTGETHDTMWGRHSNLE